MPKRSINSNGGARYDRANAKGRAMTRRGRPFTEPVAGKRAPLSLLVRAEIKRVVDDLARASGRTQSQEAEILIERCLVYDRCFGNTTAALKYLKRKKP